MITLPECFRVESLMFSAAAKGSCVSRQAAVELFMIFLLRAKKSNELPFLRDQRCGGRRAEEGEMNRIGRIFGRAPIT